MQLVGKAREASRVKAEGISPQNETKEKEAISNTISDESESDRAYIETLVQGARMLCRVPGGIEEAREAEELLRRADERLDVLDDPVVAASYKRAKGVWHACMALRGECVHGFPCCVVAYVACRLGFILWVSDILRHIQNRTPPHVPPTSPPPSSASKQHTNFIPLHPLRTFTSPSPSPGQDTDNHTKTNTDTRTTLPTTPPQTMQTTRTTHAISSKP